MKKILSGILLFLFIGITFGYSNEGTYSVKNKYLNLVNSMIQGTTLKKEYQIQNGIFIGKDQDREIVVENGQERGGYTTFFGPNGRFMQLNSSTLSDAFLEGGFYKLNVGSQNYSYVNSYYLGIKEDTNLDGYFKSFLTIDRSFDSFVGGDGLLTYLLKRNINTKYLGFGFFLDQNLAKKNISSYEFNKALDEYFKTHKTSFVSMMNGIGLGQFKTISLQINGGNFNVKVFPFQKNPYFQLSQFTGNNYQPYGTGNIKYVSDGYGCGSYKVDMLGNKSQLVNLYDYDSYINNCGVSNQSTSNIKEQNYDFTFTTKNNFGTLKKGMYLFSVMNIGNIMGGIENVSNSTVNEGFSINYGFVFNEGTEVYDAFKGSFTNAFLEYLDKFTFTKNSKFSSVFGSYSLLGKIFELTDDNQLYSSLKNKKALDVIKENNFYGHYRNIQDLLSFGILDILGKTGIEHKTNYEVSILNNEYTILENLGNSNGTEERGFNITNKNITDECKKDGGLKKDECIHGSFKLFQGLFDGNSSGLNKYLRAGSIFSSIQGVKGKSLYEGTFTTGKTGLDYDKLYISQGSKSGVKQGFLISSLGRFIGVGGDIDIKTETGTSNKILSFGGENIKKISGNSFEKQKDTQSNLNDDGHLYGTIGNYIQGQESSFSGGISSGGEQLGLYSLEGTKNGTIHSVNLDLTTVSNEDLKDKKINEQNSYGFYQFGTNGVYQDGIKFNFYVSNQNQKEKGISYGLNGLGISVDNDRRGAVGDVFSSYYMVGKTYFQEFYKGDRFEINNKNIGGGIFSSGKMKGKQYVVSYNKINYLSGVNELIQKFQPQKLSGELTGEKLDAVLQNFVLNLYGSKFGFSFSSLIQPTEKNIGTEMYIGKSDGNMNIIFKLTDLTGKKWLLPVKYLKNGTVKFYNKIADRTGFIQKTGNKEKFVTSITNTNFDKSIEIQEYEEIDFNSSEKLYFQTYETFSDQIYLYEVKKENYTTKTGYQTKLYEKIENYFTHFIEGQELPDVEGIGGRPEVSYFKDFIASEYYELSEFNGQVTLLTGLTKEFFEKDGTPYDVHSSGEEFPNGEEIHDEKLKVGTYKSLFQVSIYGDKPNYITVFDNNWYSNLPGNNQLISNLYGEGGNIMQGYNESFLLNRYSKRYLNRLLKPSQISSDNYFDVEYLLNNSLLTNKDFTSNLTAKYKIKLITNFEEISKGAIFVDYQSTINKYVTSDLVCDGRKIGTKSSTGKKITFTGLDMSSGNGLKDCNIEVSIQVKNEGGIWNLAKLSGQTITVKTNLFTIVDQDGKSEELDLGISENKFVLNDVTMLSSLPYDSIASIPHCKVIVKNKDTIDTGGGVAIASGTNISGKYNIIEIDVLYKNPDIKINGNQSKSLKGVVIDLGIQGNGQFENYGSEYYKLLTNVFDSDKSRLGEISKQFYEEIKRNSVFSNKKIQFFVGASHFKRTKFFGKTTFYIKSSTDNLNDFIFNLTGNCTFKYLNGTEERKDLQGKFKFKYSTDKTEDLANLEYYNVDGRDKTLYSNGFGKVSNFGNEYLIKQYQPSILSLSYIHNGKAENIDYESRIDKNDKQQHGEFLGLTGGATNVTSGRNLSSTNNSPYNGSKGYGSNRSGYGFSLISLLSGKRHVRDQNYRSRWGRCSGSESREEIWETENGIFDFYHGDKRVQTKNMSNSSWKNGVDGKTGQSFGGYYELGFTGHFSIGLKQVGTEGVKESLFVDRVLPVCFGNNLGLRYGTKYLDLGGGNKLFVVDTLSSLNQSFLDPSKNRMIGKGCTVSSQKEIEILETNNQKNVYNLNGKKSLDKNNGFPFFFTTSTPLENQLPKFAQDVSKIYTNQVNVKNDKLIKLFVAPELKKEIERATITFKIDPRDVSSTNTEGKIRVQYDLTFYLKHRDKTRPNHIKYNKLYKYLDEGDSKKTLFDLQIPLVGISSFNESFSQNESNLINKIMISGKDQITKETVKTSSKDNFSIQGRYKKFTVSEYRTGKNLWKLRFRSYYPCRGSTRYSLSISNIGTYMSTGKVYPYVGGKNAKWYNLKNNKTENNIINTFYQYTDSIGSQISNKTLMINGIPSIKNIGENQILFEGLCDVCGSFQGNIFEKQSVGMFNEKVKLSKQGTTNIFSYYEDPRNFEIKKSEFGLNGSVNYQLNGVFEQDRKDGLPYVELALIHNNGTPEVTPRGIGETQGALFYEGKKAVLVKGAGYKSPGYQPQPLIIGTDILPKSYEKFVNGKGGLGEKIEDELVIVSDGDIIIGPDVSIINAVLITKGNLIILNGNNSLKIHGGTIIQGKIFNYRININDINPKEFGYNYNKLYKNIELFNLKYPVLLTIDQRYLNSKIFNFIETIYRSSQK